MVHAGNHARVAGDLEELFRDFTALGGVGILMLLTLAVAGFPVLVSATSDGPLTAEAGVVLAVVVCTRSDEPPPAWRDDERSAITLEHLLCMQDGLDFAEDYVDAGVSNVIEMPTPVH